MMHGALLGCYGQGLLQQLNPSWLLLAIASGIILYPFTHQVETIVNLMVIKAHVRTWFPGFCLRLTGHVCGLHRSAGLRDRY